MFYLWPRGKQQSLVFRTLLVTQFPEGHCADLHEAIELSFPEQPHCSDIYVALQSTLRALNESSSAHSKQHYVYLFYPE